MNNAGGTYAVPLTKSESYSSRSQFQRKFNGPLQQIDRESSDGEMKKNFRKNVSNKKNLTYMRTFSLEPNNDNANPNNTNNADNKQDQMDKKSTDESIISIDDNIYDTVAPDSDCDDKPYINDEENETSSQEMLSRSSSTDELSNYVNIDYFLRKDSLGRSNSNIPARLNKKILSNNMEESDDNEANMSSIKSNDFDQFGSNDNILRSFQASTNSMRSFNSISTNSSSGSSLRLSNTKLLNKELSKTYPPNLSTFTPPIRDKNHQEFIFKDISEKDENSIYDEHLNEPIETAKNVIPLNKAIVSSETDFYAYTDILNSSKH